MIRSNLEFIRGKINNASHRLNTKLEDIILICVTKERPVLQILDAITSAGITDIGENKIQEALTKYREINNRVKVKWHMIGHLQRNKVKDAIKIFDMIHSVDSLRLASQIDIEAEKIKKKIDILIQVNTASEETKFGVSVDKVLSLINDISKLRNLQIRGLMTIAPLESNPENTRPYFKKLRALKDDINEKFQNNPAVKMKYLSMGMSQDYEVAIEEGANMIRIGRAIFDNA